MKNIKFFITFAISFLSVFLYSEKMIKDIIEKSIADYNSSNIQQFNSLNYPQKNANISFIMSYPSNFVLRDGIRPHILVQFTSPQDKNGYEIISNIQVNPTPPELEEFSEKEIVGLLFSDDIFIKGFPDAHLLYSKNTKYDGQSGKIILYSHQTERSGITSNALLCQQFTVYKKHIIIFTTGYACTTDYVSIKQLESRIQDFVLLNSIIGNSLVLMKY